MLNLYLLLLLSFFVTVFPSFGKEQDKNVKAAFIDKAQSVEKVSQFCEEYGGKSSFIEHLQKDILSDNDLRGELISFLKNPKAENCVVSLREYIAQMLKSDDSEFQKSDVQGIIAIVILAKLPEAKDVIEREIDRGFLSSWIDFLQQTDQKSYYQSLSTWVTKVASEIRRIDNAYQVKPSLYGRITEENKSMKSPEAVSIWTPILMNRYLTEVIDKKIKLDIQGFSNLNIIFAASTASYREIFVNQIAKIISFKPSNWILSYRMEPLWVQFRLFSLMQKAGGGEIKRELIWLSKYHQDVKVRALSLSTLEILAVK